MMPFRGTNRDSDKPKAVFINWHAAAVESDCTAQQGGLDKLQLIRV